MATNKDVIKLKQQLRILTGELNEARMIAEELWLSSNTLKRRMKLQAVIDRAQNRLKEIALLSPLRHRPRSAK